MGEYYYYSGSVDLAAAVKIIYHLAAAAAIKYYTDLGTTR